MPDISNEASGSPPKPILMDEGSNAYVLPASDDGSVGPIELGFPINFFGTFYTRLHINTNGSVTFQAPLYKYIPFEVTAGSIPIIAPFLADVDTRAAGSGRVRYGTVRFDGHLAFCVNWISVGYSRERTDKLNSFQLLLVDRNDSGLGNFDIVMNYDRLEWESGAASGGNGGLGGQSAAAGFSAGTGKPDTFFGFPGSRLPGALLDGNAATGLTRTSHNSSLLGRHVFRMRKGSLSIPKPAGRSQKAKARIVRLLDGRVLALGDWVPLVDIFDPRTDTWVPTGDTSANRRTYTATLLPDGRVLVMGGEDKPSTAELYDPATGTWRAAAPIREGRIKHTATLLPNGRVLVAGGENASGTRHASAEVYDPATNTWTTTGNLNTARGAHTATLLKDGRVLVAGGENTSTQRLASAEVYDPTTGTWRFTGVMGTLRYDHSATLLKDGRVLVAGGNRIEDTSGSAELYDPATGTWQATSRMEQPRRDHTATLLDTGHVLVTGGYHEAVGILTGAELYDPHLASWNRVASLQVDREHHDAALLNDGRLLIVGGISNTGQGTYELYDPPLSRG
ncbi:MAG TPA: kelch repeat-containing protein [Archangium sp.]|uniref:kelch repeat-containing protein n=1 Tax=Archangium sp. TaxID=1872627 RepID=UPI002E35D4C5|nr:kelch repeat-containing protein [Archangium sp.]HEX5745266.1 kelch repeat-containing protein [Archangium sp.]